MIYDKSLILQKNTSKSVQMAQNIKQIHPVNAKIITLILTPKL